MPGARNRFQPPVIRAVSKTRRRFTACGQIRHQKTVRRHPAGPWRRQMSLRRPTGDRVTAVARRPPLAAPFIIFATAARLTAAPAAVACTHAAYGKCGHSGPAAGRGRPCGNRRQTRMVSHDKGFDSAKTGICMEAARHGYGSRYREASPISSVCSVDCKGRERLRC